MLIDDIQILSGAQKSQTEFFKLFDILSQSNKQIVITSDCPAKELNIMDRLTSRFESGLTIDIKVPDLNHRIEILRQKLISETSDVDSVPDEVLSFIASSFVGVKSNVTLYQSPFTIPLATFPLMCKLFTL